MEWKALLHLNLQLGVRTPPQPHCAAFHHSQALVAVAAGRHVLEFDILTGCKLSSIDIGMPVLRMAYSPAGGHVIVVVLEDFTIKAWDLDTEVVAVLYSTPDRRGMGTNVEVHMALTPLRPWLFFGAHRRTSVNVVGTVEGVKQAAKIKADVKKPIVQLACHPRNPVLYVAYADGLVKGYNIHSFSVVYSLLDASLRLVGAGALAFHSTLEWIFVGDRSGTLLAWDVSVPARPNLIGTTQALQGNAVSTLSWHAMHNLLVAVMKDGTVHVWRPRVLNNPNRSQLRANFFETAGMEAFDATKVLAHSGKGPVYPLPRVVDLVVHPKLNFATVLFSSVSTSGDESRTRAAPVSREARRQLFAVLQGARGSSVSVIKEKLEVLGSVANILADQQQMVAQGKGTQLTTADFARKAFLYGNLSGGHGKGGPLLTLPLLTVSDPSNLLRDIPVCQPFDLELRFFNAEAAIFQYPVRAFFMDGCNLMGYNLSSGEYNTMKKLSPYSSSGSERSPKHFVYSSKQHLFLICCECRGASNEVVMYRDPVAAQVAGDRVTTVAGRDAAFVGSKERYFAVLDDNGEELIVMSLELEFGAGGSESISADGDTQARPPVSGITQNGARPSFGIDGQRVMEAHEVEFHGAASYGVEGNGALDPLAFSEQGSVAVPSEVPRVDSGQGNQGPAGTFFFESSVDRIFSTPLESTLVYVQTGSHIGLARILPDSYAADRQILSTKREEGRSVELKPDESVLQFRWQETLSGYVAGVLTTLRVLMVSADLEVICSSWTTGDKSFPPFKSLLWAGPALLFSTATAVFVLGWDGLARSILSVGTPNFSLAGVLNDRLLLACANEPSPRQKQGVDIKARLVGLLEPLLIGWSTYQKFWDPKLDLSEILYQLTSRFDSVRITPRSLDVLIAGAPVCADLAVELAQAGPQFGQEIRCNYAIAARRFSLALSILKDEYLRSRDYPRCPPTSRLFSRFRKLGEACIKWGQFDKAKEAFEVVSDFESMFNLFLCHSNPSAMRRLAQKLEETGADMELKRTVDQVLRVWSDGWARGGAFANLAAESMLPKGPEWAGGNWEIRISPPVKIPEWELSNEVTAYMKTANGAIPTMIPDHIGVYLGTLRGRGTVVEVKENMLVKRLGQTTQEESGVDNLGSGRSGSSISRNSDEWSQSGTKPKRHVFGDDVEVDEQARAAEEFKKGQFGVENSSSDEEDGAKEKKRLSIRIRDKPATGATIDINKVKAATQTFKLNDGLPRPPRRAADPVHDFFGGLASPVPSYPQTTHNVSHPAPPTAGPMMGVGPGGAAIPEDFFKETIQAGEVAMPPGVPSLQARQAQSPGNHLGATEFSVPAQQGDLFRTTDGATIFGASEPFQATPHPVSGHGLPPTASQGFGSGVVPQAQQGFGSGVPPQAQQGFVAEFGFPDGGVPPNSAGVVGKQGQLNLGSFEGSVEVKSEVLSTSSSLELLENLGSQPGKPPIAGRPSSPRKRYKPGEVPRGASASLCFKAGVAHIEQNQLADAMSCFDEAFLALAKDQSLGVNVKAQAPLCARYKIAVLLLQEIARLQNVEQGNAGAKEEMARLARHLSSLPLQAKHRIICLRTAIKRNMDVQNYAFSKKLLDLLLSKAPPNKREELQVLTKICVQRGLTDRTVEETEDASQFCAATLGWLPTIGHDTCNVCGSKFSALNSAGCTICGMGTVQRSDAANGAVASPFM